MTMDFHTDFQNSREAADSRWQDAVQPPDRINPRPKRRYDLVVIGAGTAGLVTAAGAAGLGASVALVERHRMGGDCLNSGCVPSKGLLAAARVAAQVRRSAEYGVQLPGEPQVDFPRVMQRMHALRAEIARNDSVSRFESLGVDVFFGEARFAGDDGTVRVDDQSLAYKRVAICTGSRPVIPEIPGLAETGCLTNETIFELHTLPPRLAVIGGGPIGCELSQCFARLGSKVFLFHSGEQLLPRDDPEAAAIVEAALRSDGVSVHTSAETTEVRRSGSETWISVRTRDGVTKHAVDALLVATGRAPNVRSLNLQAVGVNYDESRILVNDRLRTSHSRIYAAGDVCFPDKFTHAADFLARIVLQNALFFGRARASALTIPYCTYTSPEVAHVGLTEQQAAERGVPLHTLTQPLHEVDRAILDGETNGFVKIHLRRGTDRIVGATIIAAHAGDLICEIALAMRNGIGLKKIGSTIHPYPTQAEAIRKLGDQYNRTRLTPFVRWLLSQRLRWMR